jgi:hypothetical protein
VKITYQRVPWLDVRNYLGFDAPKEVIKAYDEHVRYSTVLWVGQIDGVEAVACGLIGLSPFSDTAYIWVLHSDLSLRHTVYLLLWSKLVIRDMFKLYENLIGWCKCDNERAQKWMKWLGAEFDDKPRRVPNADGYHYSFRITRT